MDNMSPADIRALMADGQDGFGGGWLWIIVLFLFLFGGNTGLNRGHDYATAATQQEILYGQQFQGLSSQINSVADGICSSTFALNNSINGGVQTLGNAITTEGRALQTQLAECCCNTQLAIANLNAQNDKNTCAITDAVHAEGEKTRALIQANEIQALRDKVTALEMDNRFCGVVRYPNSITYNGGMAPFCSANPCGACA